MALLWSLAIPGFGQLYNGDYLLGVVLVILELLINVKAQINLAILFSFRGQYLQALQITDYQWVLFYPCVYTFSLWQAYNRAIEINFASGNKLSSHPKTYYNEAFILSAIGGTLGIIYCDTFGPICGGLIGMAAGAVSGLLVVGINKAYHRQDGKK